MGRQGKAGMASFISLCTFCEYHGPSVVIATHPLESQPNNVKHSDSSCKLKQYQGGEKGCDHNSSKSRTSKLSRKLSLHEGSSNVRSGCSYCSSLGGGTQFLVSHGTGVSFVSTQHGLGEIYGLAKDAAVKSISCEVVENRNGRILFTNGPAAATVMAQTFRLPDKNARGFHRYFSIVIGTKMRGHMLRSWPYLSQGMEDIVTLLETKCGPPLTPKAMMELAKSNITISPQHNNNSQSFNNLKQLTSDPTIFLRLHQKFSALLTRLGSSKTEAAVIGSPVQCTLTFDEARIELLVKILSSMTREQCGVLLHNLLSGKGLEIQSPDRRSGRKVADALASVLPNNKKAEAVYFANVVLSLSSPEKDVDATDGCNKLIRHSLVVKDPSMSSFHFLDAEQCKCCCTATTTNNARECTTTATTSTSHTRRVCSYWDTVTSSRIVMKLLQLLHRTDLSTPIIHTKLLTIVETNLNKAKIWLR